MGRRVLPRGPCPVCGRIVAIAPTGRGVRHQCGVDNPRKAWTALHGPRLREAHRELMTNLAEARRERCADRFVRQLVSSRMPDAHVGLLTRAVLAAFDEGLEQIVRLP